MKTPSQLNTPSIEDHSDDRESARFLSSGTLAAGVTILLFTLVHAGPAVEPPDFCERTAQAALTSCRRAAESDFWVAWAKCDNLADPTARENCRTQASADLNDTWQTCEAQKDARLAACERLGPAPYDPVIDPSNFVARVDNPYFPLTPGTTFVYEGQTAEGFEHDEFAVTHHTRVILGVRCVEVHDTVKTDGQLTEDTLEDGLITTIDGTFVAGVNGDKPGIIMKAHPAIGDFYRQEFSLNNAEDFAETRSLTQTVHVPAGTFQNCLKSKETTPLETDLLEYKFYAPGVGNILTVDARTGDREELVRIRRE